MSEPRRLRDEGPEAVRALLRAAQKTVPMTHEQQARSRRRVASLSAVGSVAGTLAWLQGAAFGAGLGAVTVVGAHVVDRWVSPTSNVEPVQYTGPRTPPATSSAPEVKVPRELAPVASAETPEEPPTAEAPKLPSSAKADPPPSARIPKGVPSPETDSLAEEAALLERARAALTNNPADALALAETHAVRFPRGKLSIEREMVIVDALRRQGRRAEARALGDTLLRRARGSLYEARIQKLLGEQP